MDRQSAILIGAGLGMCVVLAASALGWFGGVLVCGADRAPGCVAWPLPISALVWAAFIVGVLALLVWQFRYLDR